MKFPKSVHAEGWADQLDTTPSDNPTVGIGTSSSLHTAKAPLAGLRSTQPLVSPSLATTPPPRASSASQRVEPVTSAARPQRAAAVPPQRQNQLSWMIGAGAGAVILAGFAMWAMNKTADTADVPPAVVANSTAPQTEVVAAAPLTESPPAASVDEPAKAAPAAATTVAAAPATVEPAPARVGLPVTTSKPAVDARPVAQAVVPAPRPDMVVRAAPGSLAPLTPAPSTSALQPRMAVAAAPTPETQPSTVALDSTPIVMPPTAAGPTTAPQALTPPLAAVTPEAAVTATAPGAQPLAQAPQPVPEDTGITAKVRMALAADSTLSAVPISVSTDQGVVKLEGQAPDAPTRERATVVAASATGVKAVDNRLTVAPATVVSQAVGSAQ